MHYHLVIAGLDPAIHADFQPAPLIAKVFELQCSVRSQSFLAQFPFASDQNALPDGRQDKEQSHSSSDLSHP
jgi:hypothetical protein